MQSTTLQDEAVQAVRNQFGPESRKASGLFGNTLLRYDGLLPARTFQVSKTGLVVALSDDRKKGTVLGYLADESEFPETKPRKAKHPLAKRSPEYLNTAPVRRR